MKGTMGPPGIGNKNRSEGARAHPLRQRDRSWADLPVEILNLFLDHLLFADHPRFAAVCKPWLSAASARTHFRALKFPWLLIPHNPTTTTHQTWGVYSPVEGDTTHHLDLPVTPGSGCFGASHGWLFINDWFGDILGNNYLLNPLTNQKIHLPPPILTIPNEAIYPLLNKAILSSAPTADNIAAGDCIIVASAIYLDINKLLFCRPGDETWSKFLVPEYIGYVLDFIIRDEHLYCVNGREEVFVFKFGPQLMLIHMYRPTRTSKDALWNWNTNWPYLVERDGELLMILRYTDYIEDENAHVEADVHSCDCLLREPSRFEVFKFDQQGVVWVQMKNLGDQILFLGLCCSMSIIVDADDSKFKRNCIYFTDDYFDKEKGPHKLDWGVFCLDDETVRRIYPNDFQSHKCPPLDFQSHKCPPLWLSLNT